MIIDMHCHTSHGSFDSFVSIDKYINRAIELGIDGILITDHNSYKCFDYMYKHNVDTKGIVIFKGLEYDTCDAGHVIVILPDICQLKELNKRGKALKDVMRIVKSYNGVIGVAHPFCRNCFSAILFKLTNNDYECFDFIETFNASGTSWGNARAKDLAESMGKPCIKGSDAHRLKNFGFTYTCFKGDYKTNDELINAIKNNDIEDGFIDYDYALNTDTLNDDGIVDFKVKLYYVYNKIATLCMKVLKRKIY